MIVVQFIDPVNDGLLQAARRFVRVLAFDPPAAELKKSGPDLPHQNSVGYQLDQGGRLGFGKRSVPLLEKEGR